MHGGESIRVSITTVNMNFLLYFRKKCKIFSDNAQIIIDFQILYEFFKKNNNSSETPIFSENPEFLHKN